MVLGNINIHAQNPDFLFMVEYAIKAPSEIGRAHV